MSNLCSSLFCPQPVYFGGSRHSAPYSLVEQVLSSLPREACPALHVGCQLGADAAVIEAAASRARRAHIFTVAPEPIAPYHVREAALNPLFTVTYEAGGRRAPMRARYLLRSRAGLVGCSAAVFFWPGPGSLAVAREAVKSGLPVFAFTLEALYPPAPVPATAGTWSSSFFNGFVCWQFLPAQTSLI